MGLGMRGMLERAKGGVLEVTGWALNNNYYNYYYYQSSLRMPL